MEITYMIMLVLKFDGDEGGGGGGRADDEGKSCTTL